MEQRIDEIQRLTVKSKVSITLMEEQFSRLSRQIASSESSVASVDSGSMPTPLKKI
jgi:hypothetical protein